MDNRPVALVIGDEGKGLRRLTKELCDEMVGIPMFGTVESLNVSVATGVLLFELRRKTTHAFTLEIGLNLFLLQVNGGANKIRVRL